MSAVPKIIEGTWEEISKRAAELSGHRLKVVVLDDSTPVTHPMFDKSPEGVKAWGERLRRWALNRKPLPQIDDSRESIYEDRS